MASDRCKAFELSSERLRLKRKSSTNFSEEFHFL